MNVLTAPVVPLFIRYSFFSVLGMLAISSAGVVDGYFVGNFVGSRGLAAINVVMPIFSLLFGVALCLGIGGSVVSGKLLALKNKEQASVMFTKTILSLGVIALLICGLFFVFMAPILAKMGANKTLLPHALLYFQTMIGFIPFLMIGIALDHFARVDNRPGLAFAGLGMSAGVNILLDWLFVAKFGWGLEGAAFATGLSFVALLILLLPHFLLKRGNLHFVWPKNRNQSSMKAAINGASEFINETSVGITTLIFNLAMLSYFDVDGVAAFSVITYWLWIGQMGMFGICDAIAPLVSKNFGVHQYGRIRAIVGLGIIAVLGIGVAMITLLLNAPEVMAGIFLRSDAGDALKIVLEFSHFVWPVFLFNGTTLVISATFTALQKPRQSTFIAILRSLILPAFFIFTIPLFVGPWGVFLALPLAELIALGVSLALLRKLQLCFKNPL
jgi:Na+-driven multidrug efflux pump